MLAPNTSHANMLEARWSHCNSFRSLLAQPLLSGLTMVCTLSEGLIATLQASMATLQRKTARLTLMLHMAILVLVRRVFRGAFHSLYSSSRPGSSSCK